MSRPKAIDLFSGFGGFSLGAKAAGYEVIAAFEKDEAIASVYRQNLGSHVRVADLSEIDYNFFSQQKGVDLLLASPPCQDFSTANPNANRNSDRARMGHYVAYAIERCQPRHLLVENVVGFEKSRSFEEILRRLDSLAYNYDILRLDAADYGVPQNRKRLFIMASRERFAPPMPTHHWQPTLIHEQWVGWYDAIADLLPSLPDSELAPWQLKRLPEWVNESLLVDGKANKYGSDVTTRGISSPSFTVCASVYKQAPKALLIERVGARLDRDLITREPHQPSNTVRALGCGGHWRQKDAILDSRVVALSPRCLARLQTFPDDFHLPEKKALSSKGIGNAVPPLLVTKLINQFKQ